MNPFTLLICFMTLWHLGQAAENALFYDLNERKLVEIGKFDNKAECKSCISACPATSNSIEELFNEKASITKNSIFLRDVYSSPTTAGEMKIKICEKLISPSLIWNKAFQTFKVGYEMYYEKESIDLECPWYDYYFKVVDGRPSLESKEPTGEDEIKIHRGTLNTEFELVNEPNKRLIFYFITVYYYKILNDGNSRVVHYADDTNKNYQYEIRTISYCQNYLSGDNKKIISAEKNPNEGTSKQPENTSNRLIKAQILPMRMFHTMAARLATCMYLNFAFIWENIVNTTLKKIDLYLYALYRLSPTTIDLSFGVDGDLQKKQRLDATVREEIASEDVLFNKFPVPEILFRIVKVIVNRVRYGVVIVIHNNVKSVQDKDRICSVEDETESWDAIKNIDVESGLSYACAKISDALMLEYDDRIFHEPLRLNNFPFWSDEAESTSTDYKNLLDEIDQSLSYIKQMDI